MTLPSWYDNWLTTNKNEDRQLTCEQCGCDFDGEYAENLHTFSEHCLCPECFSENYVQCSNCLEYFDLGSFDFDPEQLMCVACIEEIEEENQENE